MATIIIVLSIPLYLLKQAYFNESNAILNSEPQFVGKETCIDCHKVEYDLWTGSDHDLAMDHATDTTVLGDFNDFSITINGITTRFFRQDGKFMVNTEGPGGEMQDFEAIFFAISDVPRFI